MPRSPEPIGRLELEVLRFVADHPGATVREVAAHFAEISGQARTTLLTVMKRLCAKGYLKRRKVDGLHRYTASEHHGKVLTRLVGEFIDEVLGGSVSPFVAYLAKSSHLSEQEFRKLEDLLERIEKREQREGDKS